MKIGIVVHGPGIVDSGYARKLIAMLSKYGETKTRLGGTMGRTAVIDAHLEEVIDIKHKLLPSQSINKFMEEGVDIIFLLNYGKSSTTGHAFGYKVQSRFKNPPLIQIERPGEPDGSVISWKTDLDQFAGEIAGELNLKFLKRSQILQEIQNKTGIQKEGGKTYRKIAGVSPQENIFINNIVVGRSYSSEVTLIAEDGLLTGIIGGDLKEHGVEKLDKIDMDKAIIKTGLLRKSAVQPRIIDNNQQKDRNESITVAYLDHAAYDIYQLKKAGLVITVGDDTTLVAADILFRFNVPIFGITDGDLDKVVEKGYKAPGSIIVELEYGWDDIIGKKIYTECFKGKETIKIDNIENFKNELIQIIKEETKTFKIIE
ncbi:MAG TPA: DUF2117 domain-containing protein [Methanobacterium sp.]|nr:DUF2117 domain-containing protein [Methanobacterium sp.]